MNMENEIQIQISFKNLDRSDAVETLIREKIQKLQLFHAGMISCHVVVSRHHHHHHQGNLFHVAIDLSVPGHRLVANREPDEHHAYTDVYVAIRDAFNSMGRQLEDLARHQQGKVKSHAT